MKKITTLFTEERNQLQIDIESAKSIDAVVKLVQNRLDNLERVYISELNLTQVRLAAFFLDMLRQSISNLAAANFQPVTTKEAEQIINPISKVSANRLIIKLLKVLLYLGIVGWLFYLSKTTPGAWMGILLTAVLLGLEVVLQLDKSNAEENSTSLETWKLSQPTLRVDSKILLDNLADALNTIDLAVARFAEGNKSTGETGIEELPELLGFLQKLMGASFLDKPQMAIALTQLLPQILMEQGIRAQIYKANDTTSDRNYFDFEPSIDPETQDYVTLTPALLKGDRLLRRGRVIEPAYSQARES
ncbi:MULTISPECIES: hypothetical protein [unclassified Tolypothrix]|uniref:hypothetical protein n=1 Tax=unclassified Tolypothrix TaxID=2649714 RepID=UPI0005EAC5FF|nr:MULTISPECIES: hypothetical protein [unclassified Tolypothrix]BAY94437.1 hypothetical protein NIES3275_64850 [Microchaete diplosiphon NIES-3275]EKF02860.1 hypothetical protein FDUTEX481_05661 [Tolypothrix sp. PCC 7601]MBE9083043.1 hypothetical protein [Tolypothrix sp. LEGE 11397]UYD28149.1 hypothetical protein HGR01_08995 [Tolypothrix sp. PCC 7712]UYD35977.1 hypothetical protein HG267_09610 [Tolypothrix sp. PCC 7601]